MRKKHQAPVLLILFLTLLVPQFVRAQIGGGEEKPNIILITLDDANDFFAGLDGHPQVKMPNMKFLSKRGTTFYNGYCNAPKCGPSRVSMYTGKDPDYTKIYTNIELACNFNMQQNMMAKGISTIYTLPEVLKDAGGYYTYSISKNMQCHDNLMEYQVEEAGSCDIGLSWHKVITFFDGSDEELVLTTGTAINEGIPAYNFAPISNDLESEMQDYKAVDSAIAFVNDYAEAPENYCDRPFFLALGFRKPHGPMYIPQKYFPPFYDTDFTDPDFDITYDIDGVPPYTGIVLPPQPDTPFYDYYTLPANGVARAYIADQPVQEGLEVKIEEFMAMGILPEFGGGLSLSERKEMFTLSYQADFVMAYIASMHFVDAQLGRLFAALKSQPELLNNTVIILTSDHGYGQGERRHWKKGALWETDIRVPIMIVDFREPVQQTIKQPVSQIDLFPTILDLAGTPAPTFPDGTDYLDGTSLLPLMADPSIDWVKPVLTSYRLKPLPINEGGCYPGYSIRTPDWHYIQYRTNGDLAPASCDLATSELQEELYHIGKNRNIDPNEWYNLAYDPEYLSVKEYLKTFLPGGENFLEFAKEGRELVAVQEAEFTLFPNPANDIVTIATGSDEGIERIAVFNMSGQLMIDMLHPGGPNIVLRTADWQPGLYKVVITDKGKIGSKGLVIQ